MKTKTLSLLFLVLCLLVISNGARATNATSMDITADVGYDLVVSAGFLPPLYEKIYWLSRSGDASHIFVYDLKDKSVIEILKNITESASIENLAWSPDGKKLLYIKKQDIYSLDMASGKTVELTFGQDVEGPPPVWISDSEIVYVGHDAAHQGNSLYE